MTVGLPADVADTVALTAAFDRIVRELGGVDIWINNAGISPRVDTLSLTEAEWDRVLDLNLRAAFTGAKLAARHVRARGAKGVIVNIVSSTVKRATGNPVHYRVSKHGLVGLTQSLAVELGPSGIRCVAVAPTLTETPRVAELRAAGYGEGLDKFTRRLPLGRAATADEVARVVLFAISDLAEFVTGTTAGNPAPEVRHQPPGGPPQFKRVNSSSRAAQWLRRLISKLRSIVSTGAPVWLATAIWYFIRPLCATSAASESSRTVLVATSVSPAKTGVVMRIASSPSSRKMFSVMSPLVRPAASAITMAALTIGVSNRPSRYVFIDSMFQ